MGSLREFLFASLALTLSACSCGSDKSVGCGGSTGTDGGSTQACTAAPTGTCSNNGSYCGGSVGCCPAGSAWACPNGACFATQAAAQAACANTCINCGGASAACTAAGSGSCANNAAFCGAAGCCPAGSTFACPNGTCYPSLAAAQAACPSTCISCTGGGGGGTDGGGGGGSCANSTACSSSDCPSTTPFACIANRTCYATAAQASAACGNACVKCIGSGGGGTDGGGGGGGACLPTPAGGACTNPEFPLACGLQGCCPQGYPFVCESAKNCYATEAGARAACGTNACYACAGGGGGGSDGGTASCTLASGTGSCPAGALFCGATGGCCPAANPYTCATSSKCYTTAEAALAGECSTGCIHCK